MFQLLRVSWTLKMNATLLLLNLAYLGSTSVEAVDYITQGTCTPTQQKNVLQSVTACETRETLIDLKEYMPNISSNVLQVIPDYATVRRCGGSCDLYSQRCVAKSSQTKRLEVMLVVTDFSSAETETQCGYVEVEEHVDCACDCPVQPHHCRPDQYFDRGSCRCLCQDQARRSQCILNGKQWDPTNCRCMCPISGWRVCSTGYIFDATDTCQCVPTSTTASVGLLVATFILLSCIVITIVGTMVMYQKKIGLFKNRRHQAASASSKNLSNYDLVENNVQ